MYTKKEQRLLNKYEREDALMYPVHASDFDNPLREQFISDLINNEHFVETNKANDKKYDESLRSIIKKFGKKDYIAIIMFSLVMTGAFGFALKDDLFRNENAKTKTEFAKQTSKDVLIIVMMLLAGMLISGGLKATIKQANQELSIEKFYQRIAVRLFDEFSRFYPELKEEALQQCNPEMARVVKTLMLSNMPSDHIFRLKNIALDIAEHRYSQTNKAGIEDLKARERLVNSAIAIVESYLINNPELRETILNVFRGHVPNTFVLQSEKQKTK